MPTNTESWAELAEFRDVEPSALAFRALIALLDTWPGDDQANAIASAESVLRAWPDSVRLAPWSWCKAAARGQVLPTWKLVRAVQLMPSHLGKGKVNLARLAHFANLEHLTELELPTYSDFHEISFLYHHPESVPGLKKLRAVDKRDDGEVRALAGSPLWQTLQSFEVQGLTDSLAHTEPSRIVPQLPRKGTLRHLTLRAHDLVAIWEANALPELESASVFIRSVEEAKSLAERKELGRLTSLSIAFRCGFSGSSGFEPFLGNIIAADESAANAFFGKANLRKLQKLSIYGYSMGYWGREGLGHKGLNALIASGLLKRLTHLRLQLLPLGDSGVAKLAPALGRKLESLELRDVYCKGKGAAALLDSPCLPWLRCLDLSGNRIDSEHYAQLAAVSMPHLESIDFSGPRINPYYWNIGQQPLLDAGAIAWAKSPNVGKVKQLRMKNCFLGDAALQAIFQSSQLRHVETLDLAHNSFSAKAIKKAVVDSSLWQTLQELGLSHCRLDNEAMESLSNVEHAPALRSLDLGYNNIGPRGAKALAKWQVLSRVWRLELHDNYIGDDGLIALAKSPYFGRLVELDLEQDCWNSRAFTFGDRAASALARSKALPRLDSLFSGCVDEYHGTSYSPGFTKKGLNAIRKSKLMRPAFRASCSDFSGIGDYFERGAFNEDAPYGDGDFRQSPPKLDEREATSTVQNMRQIGSKPRVDNAFDWDLPPKIRPSLPEVDYDDEDVIEGLEHRDPTPVTDLSLSLELSLVDRRRPLPGSVGKVLTDTMGSILNACGMGGFQLVGSSSTKDENGGYKETSISYAVDLAGDPEPAVQLLRECLWWLRAPAGTKLEKIPLKLNTEPENTACRFVQLATLSIARWKAGTYQGYRVDRVPLTPNQRKTIQKVLAGARAGKAVNGWASVSTKDRGRMSVHTRYLKSSGELDTLNILVDALSPQVSELIHRLMKESATFLCPMSIAATKEVAQSIDADWPKVDVIDSADQLHSLLERGPYHWWKDR